MRELILKLDKNQKVTPGTLGMTGAKNNFYRWAKELDELVKIGNHYYVA